MGCFCFYIFVLWFGLFIFLGGGVFFYSLSLLFRFVWVYEADIFYSFQHVENNMTPFHGVVWSELSKDSEYLQIQKYARKYKENDTSLNYTMK